MWPTLSKPTLCCVLILYLKCSRILTFYKTFLYYYASWRLCCYCWKWLTLWNNFITCFKQFLPWTAIQSLSSSPSGSCTTERKLIPELRDAWACLCNEYRSVPGENRFFGRKVWNKRTTNITNSLPH